jgi:predicted metal-dependent enzyme (double-stranded beta helix superfamily)
MASSGSKEDLARFIFDLDQVARQGPEAVKEVTERWLQKPEDWLPRPLQELGDGDQVTYPLYDAPDGSFCAVALNIKPGTAPAVHDHGAWAVLAIYRGRVRETWFRRLDHGELPGVARLVPDQNFVHEQGGVAVLPEGQIHTARGLGDTPAITIQIYGTSLALQGHTSFDIAHDRAEPYVPHYTDAPPLP